MANLGARCSPYIGTKRKYPIEAEGVAALLKEGVWNKFKITAKGSLYTVELNGTKVLEYTSDQQAHRMAARMLPLTPSSQSRP